MEFQIKTLIDRTPAEVFAFFRDIDQLPWHTHAVVAAYQKISPGSTKVGTKDREIIRIFAGISIEIDSEITIFQPYQRLGYLWKGPAMHGELVYELQPVSNGTRVTRRQTLEPHGLFRLLRPFIQRMFSRSITTRLESIRAMLEGRAAFSG